MVSFVLFNLELAVSLKSKEVAFNVLKADCTAKGNWVCGVAILKLKNYELFVFWNF